MTRRLAAVILTVTVAVWAGVVFAGLAKEAPETVVIKGAAAKKTPVTFPHKAHVERVACDTCHHAQKGLTANAAVEVKPCSACHLDPQKPDVPSMREMSLSKNPFHKLCIDCHKTGGKGPTKCAECHKAA